MKLWVDYVKMPMMGYLTNQKELKFSILTTMLVTTQTMAVTIFGYLTGLRKPDATIQFVSTV